MKTFTAFFMLIKLKLLKSGTVLKSMFSNKAIILSLPLIATLELNTYRRACFLLFLLMCVDFVTGIIASHYRKINREKENPNLPKKRLISSSKLKKSGVKVILYLSTILLVYSVQKVFKLKTFMFSFSELELNATLVIIGFWCVTEFYSIVFENFKDMGFDVWAKFLKIAGLFKKAKNEITE